MAASLDASITKNFISEVFFNLFWYKQKCIVNHLSANPQKWSNTLKQFFGCSLRIFVFDHHVKQIGFNKPYWSTVPNVKVFNIFAANIQKFLIQQIFSYSSTALRVTLYLVIDKKKQGCYFYSIFIHLYKFNFLRHKLF